MRGIVLTDTTNLSQLVDQCNVNALGAFKVIDGWGIDGGWTYNAILTLLRVPLLIVRTSEGDGLTFDVNRAMAELSVFYSVRSDIVIEIGNEPNKVADATDDDIWIYRYNVSALIKRIRAEMPRAKIILTAMLTDHTMPRWLAILADLTPAVEYVGIHAYGWHTLGAGDTNQLADAIKWARQYTRPYAVRPLIITELGIHDPAMSPATKAQKYRSAIAYLPGDVIGTVCYHVCDRPIDDDQRAYALPLDALKYLK